MYCASGALQYSLRRFLQVHTPNVPRALLTRAAGITASLHTSNFQVETPECIKSVSCVVSCVYSPVTSA